MSRRCNLTYQGPSGKFIDPDSGLEWDRTYNETTGEYDLTTHEVDEAVVMRLATSVEYGERWTGEWLDAVGENTGEALQTSSHPEVLLEEGEKIPGSQEAATAGSENIENTTDMQDGAPPADVEGEAQPAEETRAE